MKIILIAAMTVPDLVIGRTTKPCTCAERAPNDPHAHWDCQGTYVEACNELPWPPRTYPQDMKHFKELTTGHAVVYGRKTFESFPGQKPLPNRENILVSSMPVEEFTARVPRDTPNVSMARTLSSAIACAKMLGVEKCFLIGGVRIFEEGLKIADELELTLVSRPWPGDVKFPPSEATLASMVVQRWGDDAFVEYASETCPTNDELTFTSWRRL